MSFNVESAEENIKSKFLNFPVVGVGASAGGLEAMQTFFRSLPAKPGAAFVVVQHLSPDYKSLMDELLARHTSMDIHVVTDGIKIQKDSIYLIPPKSNMTLDNGRLYLKQMSEKRSLDLPIDIFFRSLAKDQEKNAIGIILSGTGSDGTLGIRSIKESGGMIMVQDNKSAKFDGMPRSSISTGLVDFILPPNELAEELIRYIMHPFINSHDAIEKIISNDQKSFAQVLSILLDRKGVDFSEYKQNTVIRRLEKRISINRYDSINSYVEYLNVNNREVDILFNELLIGVTRFFRDSEAFQKIQETIIPNLVNDTQNNQDIRIWVPGCSTGEEAYSIAILFKEYLEKQSLNKEVKVFATDLDSISLEYASTGLYPDSIANDVTPNRLSKYFIKKESGYQVSESIRSMIIFAKHNLIQDPPFSKLDFISCRNLLIYLNPDVQQKVLSIFHVALKENGFMFLGNSESLGNIAEGFAVIDSKNKIYRIQNGYKPSLAYSYGTSSLYKSKNELKSISTVLKTTKPKSKITDELIDDILSEFMPPSIIIDENFEIVHTIHDINNYISLPVGKASLNLLKMLEKEIAIVVNNLIRRCKSTESRVLIENLQLKSNNSVFSIACKKIHNKKIGELFFILSFLDSKENQSQSISNNVESLDLSSQYQEQIDELEKEIQSKSESLQATVEELETSNEELQSSNEELIASNEELQSTNEELQSVNEELYTVNAEHIKKIEELTELNSDMDNLLKNTKIGNLFLDRDLNIRKVNEVATKITNVLPSDKDRPIYHLAVNQLYTDFVEDIKSVIQTLQPIEKDIIAPNKNSYLMRIIPYRTSENAVNGIIITFVDISLLQKSRQLVESLKSRLDSALKMGELSWWEWDYQQNYIISGKGMYEMLGYSTNEIGSDFQSWTSLIHPDDYAETMEALQSHLDGKGIYTR